MSEITIRALYAELGQVNLGSYRIKYFVETLGSWAGTVSAIRKTR